MALGVNASSSPLVLVTRNVVGVGAAGTDVAAQRRVHRRVGRRRSLSSSTRPPYTAHALLTPTRPVPHPARSVHRSRWSAPPLAIMATFLRSVRKMAAVVQACC